MINKYQRNVKLKYSHLHSHVLQNVKNVTLVLLLKTGVTMTVYSIDLNKRHQRVPYQHVKMEDLHCLPNIVKKGDYMPKLDLKDAYFLVPLNPASRKFVRFL